MKFKYLDKIKVVDQNSFYYGLKGKIVDYEKPDSYTTGIIFKNTYNTPGIYCVKIKDKYVRLQEFQMEKITAESNNA